MLDSGIDFEDAWSEFLHEFFAYQQASFFEFPSPESLNIGWQSILAGAAEYLSKEFDLPIPEWVNEPQYFLPDYWDPVEDLSSTFIEGRARRMQNTPEAFLKRKVIFEARNLITL